MAAPYVEQGFSKPDFLQKLFRLPARHNAIIGINNLLARAAQVTDVTADEVRTVTDRYKTALTHLHVADRVALYARYDAYALKDDEVYDEEAQDLKHLQALLALTAEQAAHVHLEHAGRIYQEQVDNAISAGRFTDDARQALQRLAKYLALSEDDAHGVFMERVGRLLNERARRMAANHKIAPDQEAALATFAEELGVNLVYDSKDRALLEKYRLMWRIEDGDIPEVPVPIALQHAEKCYFMAPVRWLEYLRRTTRVRYGGPSFRFRIVKGLYWRAGDMGVQVVSKDVLTPIDSGQVYVTSRRVILEGARQNVSIPISSIIDFHTYKNGVELEKATGKNPFLEFSHDIPMFALLLRRLLHAQSA